MVCGRSACQLTRSVHGCTWTAKLQCPPASLPHLPPAAGSGPAARCQAPDNRGSPKVCSGGAVVTSAVPTGVAVPSAADSGGR